MKNDKTSRLEPSGNFEPTFTVMQTAFLAIFVFPPPAAGTGVVARGDCACARFATDGGIALVMQRVHRDIVCHDVGLELAVRPIGQWARLD